MNHSLHDASRKGKMAIVLEIRIPAGHHSTVFLLSLGVALEEKMLSTELSTHCVMDSLEYLKACIP